LDGLGAWIGVVSEVIRGTTFDGGAGSASGTFGKTVSKTKSGLFDGSLSDISASSSCASFISELAWLLKHVTDIVAVPSLTMALKQ
ncbi:hypothetical protein Tco_1063766, partial [Tanacetum coccineum]